MKETSICIGDEKGNRICDLQAYPVPKKSIDDELNKSCYEFEILVRSFSARLEHLIPCRAGRVRGTKR